MPKDNTNPDADMPHGWWWKHFNRHPNKHDKLSDAYHQSGKMRMLKAFCMMCFRKLVEDIKERETEEYYSLGKERCSDDIVKLSFACLFQLYEIQNKVKKDQSSTSKYSPQKPGHQTLHRELGPIATLPFSLTAAAVEKLPQRLPLLQFADHDDAVSMVLDTHSLGPSDSVSQAALSTSSRGNIPLEPFSAAGGHASSVFDRFHTPQTALPALFSSLWSPSLQRLFEEQVVHLTAAANLPLSWVDNVKEKVRGKAVTLQADGWTGVNNQHLIAFIASVDGQLYTVKVHDASLEHKTAENLLCVIKDVINTIEVEWGERVTALVTDVSGECRKAKIDLVKDRPSIIALDCFAHQVNLVVRDYFSALPDHFESVTENAASLIAWL
ncbi:hypothetical protein AN958_08273 [Leucoagaricus sp. SymC.cos]|nr:hypothetical protein AN958_08273 [Leucoagaricus sp. SymC.cos]